jgi:hypothetical protein
VKQVCWGGSIKYAENYLREEHFRGNSKCKGPEARTSLLCWRQRKEASGLEWTQRSKSRRGQRRWEEQDAAGLFLRQWVLLFCFIKTRSHYVAQAGLDFLILLP